jgi:protein gp37
VRGEGTTMSDHSAIEWTDSTWNPIRGFAPNRWQCSKISPGCDNCYASTMNHRWGGSEYLAIGEPSVFLDERVLKQPLSWREPRMVFVCSMTDLFGPWVPMSWIEQLFRVMASAPQHQFQVLTKRPSRMAELVPKAYDRIWGYVQHAPLANVWLGTSIELNRFAWRANPLRAAPAAIRFVSAEPLLGPLPSLDLDGIDWLITGGESGVHHRECDPSWVRDLRDRCQVSGTAFFHKQWGGRTHAVGGCDLDGREHKEFPNPRRLEGVRA